MAKKYIDFPIQEVLNLRGMVVDFTELSDDKIITIHGSYAIYGSS